MKDLLVFVALCALAVFGIQSCSNSDWYRASEREKIAQERADATPHVIRQADGCKVYAFKSGDWHYFTRCGDGNITTERNWTERQGKQTIKRSETIVTNGNS